MQNSEGGGEKRSRSEPGVCDWVLKVVSYYEDSWKDEREECNLR